jgi:hypothetical protein
MAEENQTQYPREQLWELYESLPDDLKKALFSEKTAQTIDDICKRNNLEEKTPLIAQQIGYVLLGLLPPDDFQKTLIEELQLDNNTAKKVSLEVSRFVFFPVKSSLEMLYKTTIEKPLISEKETVFKEKPADTEVKAVRKKVKDVYREPIE